MTTEVKTRAPSGPPDGGWSWVILFGAFMVHVIGDGVIYTFGIFYVEFLKHFDESKGMTSWITSILVGSGFCFSPITGRLTKRFGPRVVTITGSILAAIGMATSTVVPDIAYLFFTIGVCSGIGLGLMFVSTILCVSRYFEKRRALATGITVCGSGVGTFVLAPVTEWLIEKYDWRGAMLVLSGIILNCCVFGALFRPLVIATSRKSSSCSTQSSIKTVTTNVITEESEQIISMYNNTEKLHPSHINKCTVHSESNVKSDDTLATLEKCETLRAFPVVDTQIQKNLTTDILNINSLEDLYLNFSNCDKNSKNTHINLWDIKFKKRKYCIEEANKDELRTNLCCQNISKLKRTFLQIREVRLMTNVVFLMFFFSNFLTSMGFIVPILYTKDRVISMFEIDGIQASYLLSMIGIANTIGRVVFGYISDWKCVNRLWLYNFMLVLCGLTTILSSKCYTYTLMAICMTIFGVTSGTYVSLTSVILVDLVGLEKMDNAFGLVFCVNGVANIVGPPITGFLYDYTGSYDPGFYLSGGIIAISGLMLFFIPYLRRKEKKKSNENDLQL